MKGKFIFVGAALVLSSTLGVLITVLSAKFFSKEILGEYQYFLTVVQLFHLVLWRRMDQFVVALRQTLGLAKIVKGLLAHLMPAFLAFFAVAAIILWLGFLPVQGKELIYLSISGVFMGISVVQNQFYIIRGKEFVGPALDVLQKGIFIVLVFWSRDWEYLGVVFIIAITFRLLLGFIHERQSRPRSNQYLLKGDINDLSKRGRRMLVSNIASYTSGFILVTILKQSCSAEDFADYMLTVVLVSFPASIFAQYVATVLQRQFLTESVSGKYLLIWVFGAIAVLSIGLYTLPVFDTIIIGIMGSKWDSIWNLYAVVWPLGAVGFAASLLERLGYELGSTKWQFQLGIIKLLMTCAVLMYWYFNEILDVSVNGLLMIKIVALVLFIGYLIDFTRNVFYLSK